MLIDESANPPFDSSLGQTRPENELLLGVPSPLDTALEQPESIIAYPTTGDLSASLPDDNAILPHNPELLAFGGDVRSSKTDVLSGTGTKAPLVGTGDRLIGDADGDGDLDRMDLRDIFSNRGTRSSGADDPRDLNGNGRIDRRDARMLRRELRGNRDHRAPDLMAVLANDTTFDGGTNSDRITSDATISGTVTDRSTVTRLQASFDDRTFVDVTDSLEANGSFSLERSQLELLYGGPLPEGENTLHLQAKDKWGNSSHFDLDFTLNRNIYTIVDIGDRELVLIDTETNAIIQKPLESLGDYPGGNPQHAWISPDQSTIYLTSDASPPTPAAITVVDVNDINWPEGEADLTISHVLILDPPGSVSSYPDLQQVDDRQPIANWTQPQFTQAHGPSFLPGSDYGYVTHWTDNRIQVIDTTTNQFVDFAPLTFGEDSRQTHGVNFNSEGTLALGTGYYYDHNEIDLYAVDRSTGNLEHQGTIELNEENSYAAFTHYTAWLDDRFALTASMQFGPTSLTPPGQEVIGPSVWLLDTQTQSARMVIGTAETPDDEGIYRSPSDFAVVGDKLYVAEEDSLGDSFGSDGFVSVFDISDPQDPSFIKRFQPGAELPADFAIAHGINATPDGEYIYVASYASDYIIKIDTSEDEVVKVYGSQDGLNAPHGGFLAGQYR